MKYLGDTPSKKVARLVIWERIKELLGARFFTGYHLVLLSQEAGDISTLLGLGAPIEHIIGVDKDKHAVAASKYKFSGAIYERCDVIEAAKKHKKLGIVSAFLDFCGPMRDSTVGKAVEVTQYLQPKAAVAIAVKMGREQNGWAEAVNQAKITAGSHNAAFYLRTEILTYELLRRGRQLKRTIKPLDFYRCSSERATGEKSEMLISVGSLVSAKLDPLNDATKLRRSAYYGHIRATEQDIGPLVSYLSEQGRNASLLLNIRTPNIMAFKAHGTRGTYKGRKTKLKVPASKK